MNEPPSLVRVTHERWIRSRGITTSVTQTAISARIENPFYDQIPYVEELEGALHCSVRIRFGLRANLADEGGVAGAWQGRPVDLRSLASTNHLGLEVDHAVLPVPRPVVQIIDWYARLLRRIFIDDLPWNPWKRQASAFPPAYWLDSEAVRHWNTRWEILRSALLTQAGATIGNEVLDRVMLHKADASAR